MVERDFYFIFFPGHVPASYSTYGMLHMQKELMYISKARNREGCKRRRIQIFFKKRRRRTFPSTYNKKKKEK
jgi:hypothetical protein